MRTVKEVAEKLIEDSRFFTRNAGRPESDNESTACNMAMVICCKINTPLIENRLLNEVEFYNEVYNYIMNYRNSINN